MSNLYSITTNKAAIAARLRVINQYAGNLPPMPPIFWDDPVPALRSDNGFRRVGLDGLPQQVPSAIQKLSRVQRYSRSSKSDSNLTKETA